MNKKRAKKLLNLTLMVFVVGVICFIYNKNQIKADSDLGTFKSEKEFNVVLDGKKVKFSIKSYSQDEVNKNYLFFDSTIFKIKRVQLFAFEEVTDLCGEPVLKLGDNEAICLVGDVGAHSQNIAFVKNDMSLVGIREGEHAQNSVITDVPSYQFSDYDNDGNLDLIIDNRDYDKNPLVDIIRSFYRWTNDSFVFDKAENVAVKYQ